jgi:hypothetical protein
MLRHRPWFPTEVHIHTGHFRYTGSRRPCSPATTCSRYSWPSDFLFPFGLTSGCPLASAYLDAGLLGPSCDRGLTRNTRSGPFSRGGRRISQVPGSSLRSRRGQRSRRVLLQPRRCTVGELWPSGNLSPSAPGNGLSRLPSHGSSARLPTCRRGRYRHRRKADFRLGPTLPLFGQVSHLLDDVSEFRVVTS